MSLITISQDFSSGGYAIAQRVAGDLQLELYDDDRLHAEALKMGVRSEYLKGLDEKSPGFFERLMGFKPEIYLDVLQSVVFNLARRGTGVIVGHGSQVLLKDFECAFHVRIYAADEVRIKKLMEDENIDEAAARKIIENKNTEFNSFFQHAFQKSFDDISQFDLILNTGKISIETAASQIVSLAKSKEIIACSINALETMDCMALEHKIHAELLQYHISTKEITLKATRPNKVSVHGLAYTEKEKERINSIIRNVPGVSTLESSIVVIPFRN